MTESDYFNAWLAYFVGAVMLSLVWWRLSRKWPHWLKYPSLLAVTVGLLVPFNIEQGSLSMAPAWLITFFEGIFLPDIGFARVAPTLVICMIAGAVLYPVVQLLKRMIKPAKQEAPAKEAEAS